MFINNRGSYTEIALHVFRQNREHMKEEMLERFKFSTHFS